MDGSKELRAAWKKQKGECNDIGLLNNTCDKFHCYMLHIVQAMYCPSTLDITCSYINKCTLYL